MDEVCGPGSVDMDGMLLSVSYSRCGSYNEQEIIYIFYRQITR